MNFTRRNKLVAGGLLIWLALSATDLAARQAVSGSTVIAVHNFDSLVIGADSRISVRTGDSLLAPVDTACKVVTLGRYIFAYTGFPRLCAGSDEEDCWDALAYAREAAERSLPMSGAAEYFVRQASDAFLAILGRLGEKHDPLIPVLVSVHAGIDAVFAGLENDSLGLVFVTVTIRSYNRETNSFQLDRTILRWFAGERPLPQYHYFGHIDAIRKEAGNQNLGVWFYQKGYVKGIRELIAQQARSTPSEVGGDIDLVLLRRNGSVEWISRKERCADR
ncbi:MAG TPA: hypothetical protein VMW43_01575 [Bacteroidota bacterium]|nr:hypothetical protein [Bacteroidota bacterium]